MNETAEKKAGRPDLGDRAKTKHVEVRFSAHELGLIDAAKRDTGMGRSTYIRQAALVVARAALRSRREQEPAEK